MKKILSIGVILVVFSLTFQAFGMTSGPTADWTETTPLPNPSSNHHSAVHDNRIYVVGGQAPTGAPTVFYDRVLYATVQPNGSIDGEWNYAAPLPPDDESGKSERAGTPVIVYEDWIYVLGGVTDYWHMERYNVWKGQINPDGNITSWSETTQLPYRNPEAAVLWNGRIYILAGWDGYSEHDDVYFAEIDPITGELSSWNKTTSLFRQIAHGHDAVVHNNTYLDTGVIYFIGGEEAYCPEGCPYYSPDVHYGIINETTGEVEEWIKTTSLPHPLGNHDVVVHGDEIFVIGGFDYEAMETSDAVYKADINPDGSLGNWTIYQHLPEPLSNHASVVLNDRLYVIGGYLYGIGPVDTVYFKELRVSTKVFFNINPNPTTPGQIITLKGVLIDETTNPLGNETVELYARPLGGSWQPITSLTTDTYGIFMWQTTLPWTTPPDIYIFIVYYPGSEMYESTYNFAALMVQ